MWRNLLLSAYLNVVSVTLRRRRPHVRIVSGAPFFKTARVSDEAMPVKEVTVVYFDPGILGCTPVFVGTRAPVQAPIDYIEAATR